MPGSETRFKENGGINKVLPVFKRKRPPFFFIASGGTNGIARSGHRPGSSALNLERPERYGRSILSDVFRRRNGFFRPDRSPSILRSSVESFPTLCRREQKSDGILAKRKRATENFSRPLSSRNPIRESLLRNSAVRMASRFSAGFPPGKRITTKAWDRCPAEPCRQWRLPRPAGLRDRLPRTTVLRS